MERPPGWPPETVPLSKPLFPDAPDSVNAEAALRGVEALHASLAATSTRSDLSADERGQRATTDAFNAAVVVYQDWVARKQCRWNAHEQLLVDDQ